VKSRGSQCNETLLVRAAVRPGKKLGSSVCCEKLAVTAMPVLTPADCSKQMQQPPGRFGRSPMVARTVRGATSGDVVEERSRRLFCPGTERNPGPGHILRCE